MTGFEPEHHPDQLPAPVPGHGNLLYTLTKEKKVAPVKPPSSSSSSSRSKCSAGKKPTPAPKTAKSGPQPTTNPKAGTSKTGFSPQDRDQNGAFGVELCRVGSVTVSSLDYLRYTHQTYLNDTLVDFACSYLLTKTKPAVITNTHIFSSMFYQRLAGLRRPRGCASERQEAAEGLPIPQRRYKRVSNFIRSVDIYSKEVVMFPVCLEDPEHWFLIVALLGAQPAVVVLDSLGGQRDEAAGMVVNFLEEERRVRGMVGLPFQVFTPTVPQQQDGFNCGIFVSMYVESILADPGTFSPLARQDQLADWFCISASSGQRSYWASVVRQLAAQQAPRRAGRRGQALQCEPPDPLTSLGCLQNNERCCFVVSAFLLLCRCNVDLNLDRSVERSPAAQFLDATFTAMARRRRNPSTPPMDPEPFIIAVNAVLPEIGHNVFAYDDEQCDAMELLESVLHALSLQPGFLVTHREVGSCFRGHPCDEVTNMFDNELKYYHIAF